MKLLTYSTRYYLLFSSLLFVITSVSIYFVLQRIVDEEIVERMQDTRGLLVDQMGKGVQVKSLWPYWEIELTKNHSNTQSFLRDTLIITPEENEAERFRQMIFFNTIDGKDYQIIVRTPKIESHVLLMTVGLPIVIFVFIWMLILLIMNRRFSQRMWSPFHAYLNQIKTFSVSESENLQLSGSKIDEFEDLRETLVRFADKGQTDFRILREFTENASHEIQTPLAIINAQLEHLFNTQTLDSDIAGELEKIYGSVQRLAKVNKSLLLLSKIENRQFALDEPVDLSQEISLSLESFSELLESKSIHLTQSIRPDVIRKANVELYRILITNLVGNAIRHNHPKGRLEIIMDENILHISNTGDLYNGDPHKLFARFSKGQPSSTSAGLGLAIAKEICDLHGWVISYAIEGGLHHLKIVL